METTQASKNAQDTIIAILNNETTGRDQKIADLLPLIDNITQLTLPIFKLIDSKLKGIYGSEYLISQGDYEPLIEFYNFLNNKFPDLTEILCSLGDIYLLNKQYSNSFDAFNKAFYKEPLLLFTAPGELQEYLDKYGSESQKKYYGISLVRALVLDDSFDDASEEFDEIIQTYGKNNEIIQNCLQDPIIQEQLSQLLTSNTNLMDSTCS
jgi:tetratricopeptide (TPR) repeat protein